MPNWCENEVTVGGPADVMLEFLERAGYNKPERAFTCQGFRPMPDALEGMFERGGKWWRAVDPNNYAKAVEVTADELAELKRGYGSSDGFHWRMRHWGINYDTTNVDYMSVDMWQDEISVTIHFDTAWGPPEMLYEYLVTKYPSLEFNWFYKEPISRFAGWLGEPQ